MKALDELGRTLAKIDGRGYKAYKEITGSYQGDGFVFHVEHVQGDPFAEPSRLRILISAKRAGFPDWVLASQIRRIAAADFINRDLANTIRKFSERCGSGKSGVIEVLRPGQEVLERTSLMFSTSGELEARIRIGLPARGRTVLGRAAKNLLLGNVVELLERSLVYEALDANSLQMHLNVVEDAEALRSQLKSRGLVSFIADGSFLPRRSGIDERPCRGSAIVPFKSPKELCVTLDTPNAGSITGMGIPEGVTLIVGGGYHGKSTLLRAIELGVYNHIPGDGRERVVTQDLAVKVRSEDGRSIAGTDISNFIGRLPGGQDTSFFHSENASGSTSQAAGIVEALEVGARCLLLDEDTCATNFMIRDARMQRLVASEDEPIIPFIDRVNYLYSELGVSTIAVVGGAGDYFDVADCVIGMLNYLPYEKTAQAKSITEMLPSKRDKVSRPWVDFLKRKPILRSMDSKHPRKEGKVRVRGTGDLQFGDQELRLSAIEQLVEEAQVRAIAHSILWAKFACEESPESMMGFYERIMNKLQSDGLSSILRRPTGDCAQFRIAELAAVLSRLRSLETTLVEQ